VIRGCGHGDDIPLDESNSQVRMLEMTIILASYIQLVASFPGPTFNLVHELCDSMGVVMETQHSSQRDRE
jgi:hypothetical protein